MPEENSTAIAVTAKDEAEAKKRLAELYLSPEVNAARLTLAFNPKSSLDLVEVAGKLAEHARAANDGDLSHAEAMLLNQAHALQAMFVKLAERAQNQTGVPQIQCLMGLEVHGGILGIDRRRAAVLANMGCRRRVPVDPLQILP